MRRPRPNAIGASSGRTAGLAVAVAVILAAPRTATPQTEPELVDRVVAIVGDTAVLQSELQEHLFRIQAQGGRLPTDRDGMRTLARQVLQQKINEVLIVLSARAQGVTITESEVNAVVDERLATVKRQFPTEIAFQQALAQAGMTSAEFRLQLADQSRAELMTQRYLGQSVSELQPVPVTEEEVRERFEAQRGSLGPKPATISLLQIIFTPSATIDAELTAKTKTEQVLSRARSGEDFGELAREYSEDAGTKANGGELGWLRKGQLLPEFEQALFEMTPGEITGPVETAVGYHIIKLDRVRGAERLGSHILIRPDITQEDVSQLEQLADSVAVALRRGADLDSLVLMYHDKNEQEALTRFAQDRLPPEYRTALQSAKPGDVVGPFEVPAPGLPFGKTAVVKVVAISPGGDWIFDDVRDQFYRQVQEDKMLEQVIDKLRASTYIESREDTVDEMADALMKQLSSVLQ